MNEVYFLLSYVTFINEKNGQMYMRTHMIKLNIKSHVINKQSYIRINMKLQNNFGYIRI